MKYKYFLLALPVIIMLTFFGCQKEIIEQEKETINVEGQGVKINKEQKIIDLPLTNLTELTTIDTIEYGGVKFPVYELAIEGDTADIAEIEPGVVMYIPVGKMGGITLYVYEVNSTGKSISGTKGTLALIVKGFQTTLDMYFNYENAILQFSTAENRSKYNSEAPNKLSDCEIVDLGDYEMEFKAEMEGLEFQSSSEKLCQVTVSNILWGSDTASYISVNGTVSIHPAVDLYMHYEPQMGSSELTEWLEAAMVPDLLLMSYMDKNYFLGNMKRLWANIYTDFDRELTFKIHLQEELEKKVEVPLSSFVIPSVPVSINVETAFEIDFGALGAIDMEIYTKNEDNLVLGLDLDRDLPEPEWYYEYNSDPQSGLKLMAKVELTAGIYLVIETEVYVAGVIGPEFISKGFIEGTATVSAGGGTADPLTANWSLSADAGVKGEAKLNLSAFHVDRATWEIWKMAEATIKENVYLAPHHLAVVQGDEQTGTFGEPLPSPIVVGAYDSWDSLITYLPVPLHFETNYGSTNPSGIILTGEGNASAAWTLGDVGETQSLNVYCLNGLEKVDEVVVTATAQAGSGAEDGTFVDSRDGNEYEWITLGDQIWMAENLAYLPSVNTTGSTHGLDPRYYVYEYDGTDVEEAKSSFNYTTYGVLYNWPAATDACPTGWHLPADEEWMELEIYLGMSYTEAYSEYYRGTDQGSQLAGNEALWVDNALENNYAFGSTGFDALPGGFYYSSFIDIGYDGYWWTASEYESSAHQYQGIYTHSWARRIRNSYSSVWRSYDYKGEGFSVRCVKD
jgi:uncharacterized protein (TIGR02145 family)